MVTLLAAFTGAISVTPDGSRTIHLRDQGLLRTYTAWMPTARSADNAPVLVLFHGWSSSAQKIAASSRLPEAAAAQGWLVIAPQGSGSPSRWALPGRLHGPDDVRFTARVIGDATARFGGDGSRVALAGFSNGAAFSAYLACRLPVVAVALVGGAGLGTPCPGAAGVPMVFVHGSADHVVRATGGPVLGGRLQAAPFAAAVEGWSRAGASVDAVTVAGWGHTWPRQATTATLAMLATLHSVPGRA